MSVVANITDTASSKAASSSSSVSSTGTNSSSDLQGSFLTLLVAQLKNQDPTNPLQNNELTSQLAQISTLSGIEKLNTTLVPSPDKSIAASLCRPALWLVAA